MPIDAPRPDYFELSRKTAHLASEISEALKGRITQEATMFLREGFIIPALDALDMAAANFDRFQTWTGGGYALQESNHVNRGELIAAVGSCIHAMPDAIDLSWSSHWTYFLASAERPQLLMEIIGFSVLWRSERERVLKDIESDWRRHFDEERYER